VCVPCKNGTRESIETSRLRYREESNLDETDPARIYWSALVNRVHKTDEGFDGLSEPEKKYFAVCCLSREVHNGGFHQFFFNSAGSYYRHALAGLEEMGATESLQLLQRAKQVLFDFAEAPVDIGARRLLMSKNDSRSRNSRSDELDRLYWKDPDDLSAERYARTHSLY
jgi:hypothetical protein